MEAGLMNEFFIKQKLDSPMKTPSLTCMPKWMLI